MIQRKQTLFLLAAVSINLVLLFIPSVLIHTAAAPVNGLALLMPKGEVITTSNFLAAILLNAGALFVSFITIFLYKKRNLQHLQCLLLAMVNLILAALLILTPLVETNSASSVQKNWVVYLVIVNVLACYLAARFIKKDINLLKSADRIR